MFGISKFTRWYDPLIYWFLIPFFGFLMRCLVWTCRVVHVSGQEACQTALSKSGGRAVYTTWHQRLLGYYPHFKGHPALYIMISQSRDGTLATALAANFGIKAVRGSSSRGGAMALKAAITVVSLGGAMGMLADGPRGPARRIKKGTLLIAQASDAPVLPLAWSADRCWMFNSWDRHILPKPFARISIAYGKPIWVSPDKDRHALTEDRQKLETELNDITTACDRVFGVERPWRRVKDSHKPEVGPLP